MKKYIPLEKLVDKKKIDFINKVENNNYFITESQVRDVHCKYYTFSKRQLWQAVGLEYIEPELLDFIDKIKEDSIFFDVGASNGIFSIYAANKQLDVYSFEPEVQNFGLLGINSYLNSHTIKHQLKIFNVAISDKNELGNIYIAKYEAGGHMKIVDKPQNVQEDSVFVPDFVQNVLKFTLDAIIEDYALPTPEYIKIDVDGSELAVINGADNTLHNRSLKSIFIELEEKNDVTSLIIDKLNSYGFVERKKIQVQNYIGLYNYVFTRDSK